MSSTLIGASFEYTRSLSSMWTLFKGKGSADKQKTLEAYIGDLRCATSPVRRLPPETLSEKSHTVFSIYAGINYGEEDRQFHLVTLVFHNTAACLNNCFRLLVKVFLAACHATPLDLILDYRSIYEEAIALLMYPSRWRSISFATFHNRVGKDVFGALKDGPELSYLKVASPRHLMLRPEKAESWHQNVNIYNIAPIISLLHRSSSHLKRLSINAWLQEDKLLDLLRCALTATHLEIREYVRKPIITDEVLQTLNITSASDSANVPFSNRNNWADHTPSSSPSAPASNPPSSLGSCTGRRAGVQG
ncbi:hypothetical protein GG344DRAFT_73974 [Lentinula edodes]|nr:hypothetical protein GG344DRAFT_73974 [Lentinula edodes]